MWGEIHALENIFLKKICNLLHGYPLTSFRMLGKSENSIMDSLLYLADPEKKEKKI